MRKLYITFMKNYHLIRATEALAEAGRNVGTDSYWVWMDVYEKHYNQCLMYMTLLV